MVSKLTRRDKEKLTRKTEIIDAAEKIFFEKSFDGASMDEIAKEAQFTKRTVYQYFANKEDLYFAVALKWFKVLYFRFEEALGKGINGYEKFHHSGFAYFQFFKDYPLAFNILNYCNMVKVNQESSPHFQEMMQLSNKIFQRFAEAIEEGKRDGSVRADINPALGAYAGVYLSIGFLNIIASKGANLPQDHRIELEEFTRYGLELISSAFRA